MTLFKVELHRVQTVDVIADDVADLLETLKHDYEGWLLYGFYVSEVIKR